MLDLENVRINAKNHGYETDAFLSILPPRAVRAIHLAGGCSEQGLAIDTHDHPVSAATLALFTDALSRYRPDVVIVERDQGFEEFREVLADLEVYFLPAIPVLQIQGLAIGATFFVALFGGTLWVVRLKRQLVIGTCGRRAVAIGLTGVLVPVRRAREGRRSRWSVRRRCSGSGSAWRSCALAPELRPPLGVVPKVALALAVGIPLALFAPPRHLRGCPRFGRLLRAAPPAARASRTRSGPRSGGAER